MTGYYGYSMSNNAVDAYSEGKRPLSRWGKTAMIKALDDAVANEEISSELAIWFKKAPLWFFKKTALIDREWHHCSSYYNQVDFYELDLDKLADNSNVKYWEELLDKYKADRKTAKQQTSTEKRALCKYLVWSGSRRHPKATEYESEGVIRGDWFHPDNENFKKNVYANGFMLIKEL